MQTCSTYAYLRKFLKKLEKHLKRGFFVKVVGLQTISFLEWSSTHALYYKSAEGVDFSIKRSKSSHDDTEENLHFKHSRLNYINNQKQKQKKAHKISDSLYWCLDVVAKTDDEIYVLSIIKVYSFDLFSLLCQRRSSCWKYWEWFGYFENLYHDAKIVDKKRISF